jgi:hypothetical protein
VRAGDHFNIIADHLSHNRIALALACASKELGIVLSRMPSHVVR